MDNWLFLFLQQGLILRKLLLRKIISIEYTNPHILFMNTIFGFINGNYVKKHRHFLKSFYTDYKHVTDEKEAIFCLPDGTAAAYFENFSVGYIININSVI